VDLLKFLLPLLAALAAWWLYRRHQVRNRGGLSREDFTAHFVGLGNDADVAEAVYDWCRVYARWQEFQPRLDDDLVGVYGLKGKHFDEFMTDVFLFCDLDYPEEGIRESRRPKIATVSELVPWVQEARAKQLRSEASSPQSSQP